MEIAGRLCMIDIVNTTMSEAPFVPKRRLERSSTSMNPSFVQDELKLGFTDAFGNDTEYALGMLGTEIPEKTFFSRKSHERGLRGVSRTLIYFDDRYPTRVIQTQVGPFCRRQNCLIIDQEFCVIREEGDPDPDFIRDTIAVNINNKWQLDDFGNSTFVDKIPEIHKEGI